MSKRQGILSTSIRLTRIPRPCSLATAYPPHGWTALWLAVSGELGLPQSLSLFFPCLLLISAFRNDRFVDRRLFYKVYAELGIENVKLIEGDEGDFWGSVMAESAQHRDSPDELLFENTIFVIKWVPLPSRFAFLFPALTTSFSLLCGSSGAHWGRGTMSLENAEDMVAGYNATVLIPRLSIFPYDADSDLSTLPHSRS